MIWNAELLIMRSAPPPSNSPHRINGSKPCQRKLWSIALLYSSFRGNIEWALKITCVNKSPVWWDHIAVPGRCHLRFDYINHINWIKQKVCRNICQDRTMELSRIQGGILYPLMSLEFYPLWGRHSPSRRLVLWGPDSILSLWYPCIYRFIGCPIRWK